MVIPLSTFLNEFEALVAPSHGMLGVDAQNPSPALLIFGDFVRSRFVTGARKEPLKMDSIGILVANRFALDKTRSSVTHKERKYVDRDSNPGPIG
jgi:hypothetical protein